VIKKAIFLALLLLAAGMSYAPTRARIIEAVSPITDGIRARAAVGQLDALADQVDIHYQRTGRFPGEVAPWSSWLDSDFSGDPVDPWGNQWYLQPTSRRFTVGSMGPDGEIQTADDLTEERRIGR